MGPDATVDFMAKVLAATPATRDQDHVRMLVDHNPGLPNRQAALLEGAEDPGPAIAAMAKGLEDGGADFLVMPCNTAHAYASGIREATSIPLLSIIDVTVDACREYNTVGLLATPGLLRIGLYQQAFAAAGINCRLQDDDGVKDLMHLVNRIKIGDHGESISAAMQALANALIDGGADVVVAGCTEIPIVLTGDMLAVPFLSSTELLARATVEVAKGERQIT